MPVFHFQWGQIKINSQNILKAQSEKQQSQGKNKMQRSAVFHKELSQVIFDHNLNNILG